MSEIFDQIGKIAEDLVNVEVNIILESDITGKKMPKPRHAFIDVGKEYYDKLNEYGCLNENLYIGAEEEDWRGKDTEALNQELQALKDDIEKPENKEKRKALEESKRRLEGLITIKELKKLEDYLGSCDAFSYMREVANYKIIENRIALEKMDAAGPLSAEQEAKRERLITEVSMLTRIKDKSDQIKGIFNTNCMQYLRRQGKLEKISPEKLASTAMCNLISEDTSEKKFLTNLLTRADIEFYQAPLILRTDQLALLRKIWEIGLDEIAMQTVVQLDGDVVTRILGKYAQEDFAILHKLHHQGVSTALGFWKDLVGLVKDFFEDIVQFVIPSRS